MMALHEMRWTAKFAEYSVQSCFIDNIESFCKIKSKELHDFRCISSGVDKRRKSCSLYHDLIKSHIDFQISDIR